MKPRLYPTQVPDAMSLLQTSWSGGRFIDFRPYYQPHAESFADNYPTRLSIDQASAGRGRWRREGQSSVNHLHVACLQCDLLVQWLIQSKPSNLLSTVQITTLNNSVFHYPVPESTNNRVLFFSIFSMVCLLGLATWQVLYLRRYFKAKKLIEQHHKTSNNRWQSHMRQITINLGKDSNVFKRKNLKYHLGTESSPYTSIVATFMCNSIIICDI